MKSGLGVAAKGAGYVKEVRHSWTRLQQGSVNTLSLIGQSGNGKVGVS